MMMMLWRSAASRISFCFSDLKWSEILFTSRFVHLRLRWLQNKKSKKMTTDKKTWNERKKIICDLIFRESRTWMQKSVTNIAYRRVDLSPRFWLVLVCHHLLPNSWPSPSFSSRRFSCLKPWIRLSQRSSFHTMKNLLKFWLGLFICVLASVLMLVNIIFCMNSKVMQQGWSIFQIKYSIGTLNISFALFSGNGTEFRISSKFCRCKVERLSNVAKQQQPPQQQQQQQQQRQIFY